MADDIQFHAHTVNAPRYVVAPPAQAHVHTVDVLVVGGGAAGLAAALQAAEQANVILLARGALRESNSAWAQGGIAAALDGSDSPRFHIQDTLIAGAGLCDHAAVEALAWEAPALMREMAALGVPFERNGTDHFALGLEGGHSQRRIVHAGDATGWAVTKILIERVLAHPRIQVLEGYQAVDLLTTSIDGLETCTGLLALDAHEHWQRFSAGATILATGGAGALYGLTSNQAVALGEGIALAYRAGAEVADMEFVQFHPTVLRTRAGQGFLISEAVRGEGARLLTPAGRRFMPAYDERAELAPRDVVTRGIFAAMQSDGCEHVLLDMTHLAREYIEQRFPTIYARCIAEGIDPATQPIPVAPASHYLMGGIRTDLQGATTLPGLYAAGECACTGVHGANRLASNSLLECLVFGRRAGAAALQHTFSHQPEGDWSASPATAQSLIAPNTAWRTQLAELMRAGAGALRSAEGLSAALAQLTALEQSQGSGNGVKPSLSEAITAANARLAARMVITSALMRRESRGAHHRTDFPHSSQSWQSHLVLARGQQPHLAETVAVHAERVA